MKAYIDAKNKDLDKKIDNKIGELKTFTIAGLEAIIAKIYQGGTLNHETGQITWPNTDKIAIGNMNVYGGGSANWIKTGIDDENDVQVN